MKFHYSDGGRSNYFKATNVGDCVTRAICNATGITEKVRRHSVIEHMVLFFAQGDATGVADIFITC